MSERTMAEQTCELVSEPAESGNVIHDSDSMWMTRNHHVLSQNQGGGSNMAGHYLQVDGSSVLADAGATDNKARLLVHLMTDDSDKKVVMLESANSPRWVVAIDKASETVIAKQAPKKLTEYKTLNEVAQQNPEMLFYQKEKSRGSSVSYFESYLSDKRRILGFDTAGKPLDPTKVDPVETAAHFRVLNF